MQVYACAISRSLALRQRHVTFYAGDGFFLSYLNQLPLSKDIAVRFVSAKAQTHLPEGKPTRECSILTIGN